MRIVLVKRMFFFVELNGGIKDGSNLRIIEESEVVLPAVADIVVDTPLQILSNDKIYNGICRALSDNKPDLVEKLKTVINSRQAEKRSHKTASFVQGSSRYGRARQAPRTFANPTTTEASDSSSSASDDDDEYSPAPKQVRADLSRKPSSVPNVASMIQGGPSSNVDPSSNMDYSSTNLAAQSGRPEDEFSSGTSTSHSNGGAAQTVNRSSNGQFALGSLPQLREDANRMLATHGLSTQSMEGIALLLLTFQYQFSRNFNELRAEVSRISAKLNRLSSSGVTSKPRLNFKPLSTVAEYADFKAGVTAKKEADLVAFLVSVGGADCREAVWRMIPWLMTHELQNKCNRSGNKEISFSEVLEPIVKRAILTLEISTDEREIERMIERFFHNAPDRMGGRDSRRKKAHETRNEE